jgi:leucyl-tRNA synthetase
MRDLGLVKNNEPFARLLTQGMVTKDGAKMSKSKGNTVDPQNYLNRFGSDTVRVFMLFASPPEKDVEWSDDGVVGAFRFLNRVWRVIESNLDLIKANDTLYSDTAEISDAIRNLRYSTHFTIRKWLEDIENRMQFNTAIAAVMEHLNHVTDIKNPASLNETEKQIYAEACIVMPRLLYIFAPHLAEELWSLLGHNDFIHLAGVPVYRDDYLQKDTVTYALQVNGKMRGKLEVSVKTSESELVEMAKNFDNVKSYIAGKELRKVIVVPNKLINIVV